MIGFLVTGWLTSSGACADNNGFFENAPEQFQGNGDYGGGLGGYYDDSAPIISLTLNPKESLNSAFRIAVREGRIEDANRLLRQNADVNSRSDDGKTALMYAARNCSSRSVKLLLSWNADVNSQDRKGRTALMEGSIDSCLPVVQLLIKARGIKLEARDKNGQSALDYAVENAAADVDGPAQRIADLLRKPHRVALR